MHVLQQPSERPACWGLLQHVWRLPFGPAGLLPCVEHHVHVHVLLGVQGWASAAQVCQQNLVGASLNDCSSKCKKCKLRLLWEGRSAARPRIQSCSAS